MPRAKALSPTDISKWPRAAREKLYAQMLAEEAQDRCKELEALGWRPWYTEIFGAEFVNVLAPHHIEAIEWHWNSLMLKRAGQKIHRYAYFAIWSRGHMKSTVARYIAVCDAALTGNGYCLYVSGTKGKVRSHAISIETLLAGKKLLEYYPRLGVVKRGLAGQSKGWQADFIYTDIGYVFHFISLDEGVAGANIDNVRPTLIIPDDVDDREASPLISENRLHTLTRAVLPTVEPMVTLILWAQNLINRHTVLYHIYTGKEHVLTSRVPTKPIPAFEDLVTEQQTIDGIIHDVIISGTPTWEWFSREKAQSNIDTYGLDSFLAECQHDVDRDKTEQILPEYDDDTHVITWAEFNAVYNLPATNRELPSHWRRYVGHDWGSSGAEGGHACVVGYVGVAAANAALPGTAFLYNLASFGRSVLAGMVARSVLNFVLSDVQSDPRTYIELGLLDRATNDPSDVLANRTRQKVVDLLASREQYAMWHMSHEQKAVRDIYRLIYGLPFQPCNPKRDGGIAQLRHYLRCDYSQEHPFRIGKMGLSRMYLIVEDDSQRSRPTNDSGMKLAREQLPEWRWRPDTLTAKGFLDERPLKISDDVGNMLMMIFTHFRLSATPLSAEERYQQSIPVQARYETLLANSPFEHGLTPEQEMQHLLARAHARKQSPSNIERFDEDGRLIR